MWDINVKPKRKPCTACCRLNRRPPSGCTNKKDNRTFKVNVDTYEPDCHGEPLNSLVIPLCSDAGASTSDQAKPEGGAATTVPAQLAQLIAAKADVNQREEHRSPLHIAAQLHDEQGQLVAQLIAASADVHLCIEDGTTPALAAAEKGNAQALRQLIAAKADIHVESKTGRTPVLMSAQRGHAEALSLLIACKAKVNQTDEWQITPASYAAEEGYPEALAKLIEAKADVNLTDFEGSAPLHCVSEQGHTEVLVQLIAARADINLEDKNGRTSTVRAAEQLGLLMTAKADITKEDSKAFIYCELAKDKKMLHEALHEVGGEEATKKRRTLIELRAVVAQLRAELDTQGARVLAEYARLRERSCW